MSFQIYSYSHSCSFSLPQTGSNVRQNIVLFRQQTYIHNHCGHENSNSRRRAVIHRAETWFLTQTGRVVKQNKKSSAHQNSFGTLLSFSEEQQFPRNDLTTKIVFFETDTRNEIISVASISTVIKSLIIQLPRKISSDENFVSSEDFYLSQVKISRLS